MELCKWAALMMRREHQLKLLGLLLTLLGSKYLIEWSLLYLTSCRLRLRREEVQKECKKRFKELDKQLLDSKVSADQRAEIVSLSTAELVDALQSGTWTPSQVLVAYQYQALEVNKRTNCITEPIPEAKMHAEALEQSEGEREGLLWGIPISVKEEVPLKGYLATVGLSSFIVPSNRFSADPLLIQVLKKHGAIPYVRTNLAQMTLSLECSNPVYGTTCHPMDPTRTPGGSSGGEGALVGGGGSLIGLASDFAGSIRVPAAFCGAVGFKPTPLRAGSFKGIHSNFESGQQNLWEAYGPMSRDVDGAVLLTKVLMDPEFSRVDPRVLPMPFDEQVYDSRAPLRIGYCLDDGCLPVSAPCRRAVLEAKAALANNGHQLVEWSPPNATYPRGIYLKSFAIAIDELKEQLYGEEIDPPLLENIQRAGHPSLWRSLRVILTSLANPWLAEKLKKTTGERTIPDFWRLTSELEAFRLVVMEAWVEAGLDALITPVGGVVATKIGDNDLCFEAISFCIVYNALDVPAGTVPVTKVKDADLVPMEFKETVREAHYGKLIRKTMDDSVGLPVGIQCVTMRYKDELCLRIMKELETTLGKTRSEV